GRADLAVELEPGDARKREHRPLAVRPDRKADRGRRRVVDLTTYLLEERRDALRREEAGVDDAADRDVRPGERMDEVEPVERDARRHHARERDLLHERRPIPTP